jgi:hypothetical protein
MAHVQCLIGCGGRGNVGYRSAGLDTALGRRDASFASVSLSDVRCIRSRIIFAWVSARQTAAYPAEKGGEEKRPLTCRTLNRPRVAPHTNQVNPRHRCCRTSLCCCARRHGRPCLLPCLARKPSGARGWSGLRSQLMKGDPRLPQWGFVSPGKKASCTP